MLIDRPCFDLTFADGTKVRCAQDHQFLTHTSGQGTAWIPASRLRLGQGCSSNVVRPLDVWATDPSRDAGYLAAALDGEGCLTQRDLRRDIKGIAGTGLAFVQKENAMLVEVERCLAALGFDFSDRHLRSGGCCTITLSRRREVLQFLGSVRPLRLLAKFQPGLLGQISHRTVKPVSRADAGVHPVVEIVTGSRTYFAEGLAVRSE